jgi:hypothetical protein
MTSIGRSKALAICRSEVAQWRRVCSGNSFDAKMSAMPSAKELSINAGFLVIRISPSFPLMDGDCPQ